MNVETFRECYEAERTMEGRCPKCGSSRIYAQFRYDDGIDTGKLCDDCGYETDYTVIVSDSSFIGPGEPGSHDRLEDYEGQA